MVDPSDPNYYWLTDPDQVARFGSSLLKTDLMLVILLVWVRLPTDSRYIQLVVF